MPSGIPDFRTPGKGLWEKVDPMKVAHIDAFRRSPDEFWTFYGQRFAMLSEIQPNPAHDAVAELERRGVVRGVITQNIDRLHRAAGSRERDRGARLDRVVHLRDVRRQGRATTRSARCSPSGTPTPECATCITPLKPNVVLFGEMLPEDAMADATALAAEADLMLCIGSSLEVYPVAGLPGLTLDKGGRIALVTQGRDAVRRRGRGQALGRRRGRARSRPRRASSLKPETLIILMIAALFGVGVLTGEGSTTTERAHGRSRPLDVERVAHRLERVRELEFERIPPVRTVSADEAREEGLAELDEEYPAEAARGRRGGPDAARAAAGGLRRARAGRDDLRRGGRRLLRRPRRRQMTLVEGASGGTEGEITLAHELTHALEDQHFDLDPEAGLDDERTAHTALVEGTATVAMARLRRRAT